MLPGGEEASGRIPPHFPVPGSPHLPAHLGLSRFQVAAAAAQQHQQQQQAMTLMMMFGNHAHLGGSPPASAPHYHNGSIPVVNADFPSRSFSGAEFPLGYPVDGSNGALLPTPMMMYDHQLNRLRSNASTGSSCVNDPNYFLGICQESTELSTTRGGTFVTENLWPEPDDPHLPVSRRFIQTSATTAARLAPGPPPPTHPPSSAAQLRVVILLALVSTRLESALEQTSESPSIRQRLSIPVPIHSATLCALILEFYSSARGVPSSFLNVRPEAVAEQLRVLASKHLSRHLSESRETLSMTNLAGSSLGRSESMNATLGQKAKETLISSSEARSHSKMNNIAFDKNEVSAIEAATGTAVTDKYDQSIVSSAISTAPPVRIIDLGEGVLLRDFDFEVCDKILRAMLDKTHASRAVDMFDYLCPLERRDKIPSNVLFSRDAEADCEKSIVDKSAGGTHTRSGSLRNVLTSEVTSVLPVKIQAIPANQDGIDKNADVAETTSHIAGASSLSERPQRASDVSLESLLSAPSAKEKKLLETATELRILLTVPTAAHSITARAFQNPGGSRVRQICPHGTRQECLRVRGERTCCGLAHFRRIVYPHTDVSLGDCSYLDTCRRSATCRFVHYEVDDDALSIEKGVRDLLPGDDAHGIGAVVSVMSGGDEPAQWINCDIRNFDWAVFSGKIKVLMADPPWDIHMDLPYGTLTDNEMRNLKLSQLQEEGVIFLWVTGRAMELGRECLTLWGYRPVQELVWVKTNQLQRIIRTGRTGHWLNHSKEHCLIGIKGHPHQLNRLLDADIIVSVVRETSRKPDEIYRIIERLYPGPYKLELFGRQHNTRNNWITLGNQLNGTSLHDKELVNRFNAFAARSNGTYAVLPSADRASSMLNSSTKVGE